MEKMNEMSMTIEALRSAAAAITEAADWLTKQFSGEAAPAAKAKKPAAKEPEKPAHTLEQVRAVLAEKSRAGYTAEIRALLAKHGAPKLSQIAPAEYAALLKDAEVINGGGIEHRHLVQKPCIKETGIDAAAANDPHAFDAKL